MKKLILSAVLCTATISMHAAAGMKNSKNFKFVGDTEYAGLCQAAATNDLEMFKQNVKQHGFRLNASHGYMLKLLSNANSFQCAGQGLVSFAEQRGSQDIANYLSGTKTANQLTSTKKYQFVGDRNFANFCKSAVTDSVNLFRLALSKQIGNLGMSKKAVLNKVLEANAVTCDGKPLGDFFEQREAKSVLGYIEQNQ